MIMYKDIFYPDRKYDKGREINKHSIKTVDTEILIKELERRGYKVSVQNVNK